MKPIAVVGKFTASLALLALLAAPTRIQATGATAIGDMNLRIMFEANPSLGFTLSNLTLSTVASAKGGYGSHHEDFGGAATSTDMTFNETLRADAAAFSAPSGSDSWARVAFLPGAIATVRNTTPDYQTFGLTFSANLTADVSAIQGTEEYAWAVCSFAFNVSIEGDKGLSRFSFIAIRDQIQAPPVGTTYSYGSAGTLSGQIAPGETVKIWNNAGQFSVHAAVVPVPEVSAGPMVGLFVTGILSLRWIRRRNAQRRASPGRTL